MIAFVAALTTRCSEDASIQEPQYQHPPRSVYHMPYNSENPYDSAGIVHNRLCDFFDNYLSSNDTTFQMVFDGLCQGIDALYDSLGLSPEAANTLKSAFANELNSMNYTADWLYAQTVNFSSQYCSDRELSYIHRLGEALYSVTDTSARRDSILAIESDMIGETWSPDETVALRGISIIKNSRYMWTVLFGGSSNSWIDQCAAWMDYRAYCATYDETCDYDYSMFMAALASKQVVEMAERALSPSPIYY